MGQTLTCIRFARKMHSAVQTIPTLLSIIRESFLNMRIIPNGQVSATFVALVGVVVGCGGGVDDVVAIVDFVVSFVVFGCRNVL
jgi:hypothetical protein